MRQRGEAVGDLFQYVTQVRELPDGYAFNFPGGDGWVHAIMDFIIEERACCPFFTFELASASLHEALTLAIRGRVEVKQMVVPFVGRATARASVAE